MFEIKPDLKFTWPVTASVASEEEPGKYHKIKFNATFNVLSQDRVLELTQEAQRVSYDDEEKRAQSAAVAVLREALHSFDFNPVKDAEGELVDDIDERREIILSLAPLIEPLSVAFRAGMEGRKAKN